MPGNEMLLDGEVTSLAAGALKILGQMGYTTPSASGSLSWMYENELLDERRRRVESERFEVASATE